MDNNLDKCEPVAEAIRERDRLGFAVVNVIGKLDEIIENTQEVEIDDFLHIAVPIDMWNELQDALEDMPKRADLYTSPQPIEKCEPVLKVTTNGSQLSLTKPNGDYWDMSKHIGEVFYTSPHPRDWVGLSEDEIVKIMDGTEFNEDNFCILEAAINYCRAIESALKQINIKG